MTKFLQSNFIFAAKVKFLKYPFDFATSVNTIGVRNAVKKHNIDTDI